MPPTFVLNSRMNGILHTKLRTPKIGKNGADTTK